MKKPTLWELSTLREPRQKPRGFARRRPIPAHVRDAHARSVAEWRARLPR